MRRGRRPVRWKTAIVGVLLAAGALRAVAIQGWLRPIEIEGGSMAPGLPGTAREIVCVDCAFAYRIGVEYLPPDDLSVCPNCGYQYNRGSTARLVTGTRVWIDRWPAWTGTLRRFDAVAVAGEDAAQVAKRLLGFPGEEIEFRDGDLWIDGRRVSKSLAEFFRLAVLVHDGDHRPQLAGSPQRWMAARGAASNWIRRDRAWIYEHSTPDRGTAARDWLEYRHRPSVRGLIPPRTRGDEIPLFDTYAYNGDVPRGPLHLVSDIVLEIDVAWGPRDRIMLELRGTADSWRVELDRAAGRVSWQQRGGEQRSDPCPPLRRPGYRRQRLAFGLLDGRLLVAIDRQIVSTRAVSDPTRFSGHTRPVAVAVTAGRVVLSRFRLWRDLYYFGPDPTARQWRAPRRTGFVLVGDNLPVSIDPRVRSFPAWRPAGRVID